MTTARGARAPARRRTLRVLVLPLPLALALAMAAVATSGAAVTATPTAGPTRAATALDTVVVADPGPGYAVTSQGPLRPSSFASDVPDPAATQAVLATLATLGANRATYERTWSGEEGHNEVRDVLVRLPSALRARRFLQSVQHSLESADTVSSTSLTSIPGARRTTFLVSTTPAGVGQAVTMRAGVLVDLLSFFTAAGVGARPVSSDETLQVARAQHGALVAAAGHRAPAPARRGASLRSLVWAALAVAVLALAVATPAFLRRHRRAVAAVAQEP